MKKRLFITVAAICAFANCGCEEENDSTLPAFDMPAGLHHVKQCIIDNELVDIAQCEEKSVSLTQAVFVANSGDGTLAYVTLKKNGDFAVVDITRSVPGVTSIPVGERPQSMASDDKGVLLLTTSSIHSDLSVVSAYEKREIVYMTLDKPARRITYQSSDKAYYVYFLDGTVRRLTVSFDCGEGKDVFKTSCVLTKDMITFKWDNVAKLDGEVFSYIADPSGDRGYVSYADRRYVSMIAYAESADKDGVCAGTYPCEVAKIGTGYGCSDGIDNDGNGQIDNEDPSCFYPWSAEGYSDGTQDSILTAGYVGRTECNDGIDNNGDGLVDRMDLGCVSWDDASEEEGYQPVSYGTCKEGRDNPMCLWPTEEPAEKAYAIRSTNMCKDGVDNDGDTIADTSDPSCYGELDFAETDFYGKGRGELGIDPKGRWLYVVNPTDSEIIVVDLAKQAVVDLSGHFPRQRSVGIPVGRVPMDVVGDIVTYTAYNKNNYKVEVEDAVVFVTTSSGMLSEMTIQKDYQLYYKDEPYKDEAGNEVKLSKQTMFAEDDDSDDSYVGIVRCVSRLCGENDLPKVELRKRSSASFDSKSKTLTNETAVYDQIIASETWRVTYEGALEKSRRSDGYFSKDGEFRTMSAEFCSLGVREGDHLVLTSRSGIRTDLPECVNVLGTGNKGYDLEWVVSEVHPEYLVVAPTGNAEHSQSVPLRKCFPSSFSYELRAAGSWIITSNSTYVNRRLAVGDQCIDNPINDYGQMRFTLDKDRDATKPDASTAFFELYMPADAFNLNSGDAYEFTTKSEFTQKGANMSSAPASAIVFKNSDSHYILISEASTNSVIIYDVEDSSIYDTL